MPFNKQLKLMYFVNIHAYLQVYVIYIYALYILMFCENV